MKEERGVCGGIVGFLSLLAEGYEEFKTHKEGLQLFTMQISKGPKSSRLRSVTVGY